MCCIQALVYRVGVAAVSAAPSEAAAQQGQFAATDQRIDETEAERGEPQGSEAALVRASAADLRRPLDDAPAA